MRTLAVLALGCLAFLATPRAGRAELDDTAYEAAASAALRTMKQPGLRDAKVEAVRTLGRDDRARSVEVLVRWAVTSGKLERRTLVPARDDAQEDFDKLERVLLKKYDKMPPNYKNDKDNWDAKKKVLDTAVEHCRVEDDVQYEIGTALAAVRNDDAIRWLMKSGLDKLRREDEAAEAAVGSVKALLEANPALVGDALLEEAESKKHPKARILALEWIGRTKNASGYAAAITALAAKADPVRRAAVACLVALDDPRCVQPFIETMANSTGTLRSELEDALHHYTGQSFDESPEVWARWWAEDGAKWLEEEGEKRWGRPDSRTGGGATFYGLQTRSKRIVFVLDRSGSMLTPADAEERSAGGAPGGDEEVEGDTKVEVAKNQLELSIRQLSRDVYFNVIFYATDVQVWKDTPEMLPATDENKAAAIEWFRAQEANGYTRTFDALLKALEYADNLGAKDPTKGGCDTIFLLSDGSPTAIDSGQPIEGDVLEAEWTRVKEANRLWRCVIHTIGIGRQHNRHLMQRIASETGGTYKGVGGR